MLFIFHVYLSHLIIPVQGIHFGLHFTIQVSFTGKFWKVGSRPWYLWFKRL